MQTSSHPEATAAPTMEAPVDLVDPFARAHHAVSLREEAARCRRLANSIGCSRAQATLFSLARDFESQADWIDPLTAVVSGRPAGQAVDGDYVAIRWARSG